MDEIMEKMFTVILLFNYLIAVFIVSCSIAHNYSHSPLSITLPQLDIHCSSMNTLAVVV